jgi:hypothetical protein
LKLVTNMGTEGRYRSIVGNVSAVSNKPWPYGPIVHIPEPKC